jgi:hypothetical protein
LLAMDSCHHTPVTESPQGARACIEPAGPGAGGGRRRRASEGCLRRQALDQPIARPGLFTAAPNVSKLSGERSGASPLKRRVRRELTYFVR